MGRLSVDKQTSFGLADTLEQRFLEGQKDLSPVLLHIIMTWHQRNKSPLWAEVKPHLSNYGPLDNQDHNSKMPATIDYLGSQVCIRGTSTSISCLQTDLVPGLGTTPLSLLPQKSAQEARFLCSQEPPLTSRMRMLQTIMEHCVPSSMVAAHLTCQQETCKKKN